MISIIVFSKGRPMQLHAYLESLLKFSDAKQEMITVLLCEMERIHYEKVIKAFPNVHWVKEVKFEENLKKEIAKAEDFIMFGCDDVVFIRNFCLQEACEYLKENEQVFGFSIRLGRNITPCPKENLSNTTNIFEWNWEESQENRYNYPWELDCTIYRKEDVCRLTEEEEHPIKNPNYYEAMIHADNISRRITRKHLASYLESGCAVVITVNRVQNTHQNGYDDSLATDIFTLDKLYNDENNTLDIEKIAQKRTNQVHVESEFFILREGKKGYRIKRNIKKKLQNVYCKCLVLPVKIDRYLDRKKYRRGGYSTDVSILTPEQTIQLLEEKKQSIIRFGEGEIDYIKGEDLTFQDYNKELAQRLIEILITQEEGLCIGIPYFFMNPITKLTEYTLQRALAIAPKRKFIKKKCKKEIRYIDASFLLPYETYLLEDFEMYYSRIQGMLKDLDVTVICGEGILDRLQYNALDECKSVDYICAPSMNAYASYDIILSQAMQIDKNRLVLIILGPTAKVLAYDLHRAGYTAWDIGHYLKDYDAYKKQRPRTEAEITQFYKPD